MPTPTRERSAAPLLLLLTCILPLAAAAEPVAIANPGFEEPYFGSNLPPQYNGEPPTGSFPVGPPPTGWTVWYEGGGPIGGALVGILNPGTAADHAPNPACFENGAPEGDDVVLLYMSGSTGANEYGVEQSLAATLQPNTRYTLQVEVGDIASCAGLVPPFDSFFDLQGFPGYRVQLLAGGQVIAEDDDGLSLTEGFFATSVVQLTTGDSPPQAGQALGIRLVNKNQPDVPGVSGLEVDFDHVRLDATTLQPVPLPAALRIGLASLLALVAGGTFSVRAGRASRRARGRGRRAPA